MCSPHSEFLTVCHGARSLLSVSKTLLSSEDIILYLPPLPSSFAGEGTSLPCMDRRALCPAPPSLDHQGPWRGLDPSPSGLPKPRHTQLRREPAKVPMTGFQAFFGFKLIDLFFPPRVPDTDAQVGRGQSEGPSMTPGAEGGPDPTDGRCEWLSPGPGPAGNTRLPSSGAATELNTLEPQQKTLRPLGHNTETGTRGATDAWGRVDGHRVPGRCRGSGPGRGTRVSAHRAGCWAGTSGTP